jgi:hypothetical protein
MTKEWKLNALKPDDVLYDAMEPVLQSHGNDRNIQTLMTMILL